MGPRPRRDSPAEAPLRRRAGPLPLAGLQGNSPCLAPAGPLENPAEGAHRRLENLVQVCRPPGLPPKTAALPVSHPQQAPEGRA